MIDTDKYEYALSKGQYVDIIADKLLAEVKRLRKENKMLWQYIDTEQMYNDGLLTVEGEMIE